MEMAFDAARQRVRVISQRMRLLVLLGVVIAVGGTLLIWGSPELPRWLLADLGVADKIASPSPTLAVRAAGLLVTAVPVGLFVFALLQSRRLLAEYAEGGQFSWSAARRLRRIALVICSLAVVGPLTRTLLILVLTFNNPPGQRLLSIGFSFNDYFMGIVGGLLLVIAWVMVEAARLAEENSGFV